MIRWKARSFIITSSFTTVIIKARVIIGTILTMTGKHTSDTNYNSITYFFLITYFNTAWIQ